MGARLVPPGSLCVSVRLEPHAFLRLVAGCPRGRLELLCDSFLNSLLLLQFLFFVALPTGWLPAPFFTKFGTKQAGVSTYDEAVYALADADRSLGSTSSATMRSGHTLLSLVPQRLCVFGSQTQLFQQTIRPFPAQHTASSSSNFVVLFFVADLAGFWFCVSPVS